MFGPDPIDVFDPSPYNAIAYYGHHVIGTLVLLAALVALFVVKGRGLHRTAGLVYIFGVFLLGFTSISMLLDRIIPPLAMAVLVSFYCVGGAYLALQKHSKLVRAGEIALSIVLVLALAGFLMTSVPVVRQGLIPPYAPAVIAFIPVVLLIGDANWHIRQKHRPKLRLARHLARMIWGFVVVVRAPLVELAAAGLLPDHQMIYVFGPIVLGVAMLWYFQRKYGGSPFGKSS